MAKPQKKAEQDLADRLHALGLRRRVANNIAQTTTNVKGQLPDSAKGALREMIWKLEDLGPRSGASKKRKRAAKDAASTKDGGAAKKSAKKAKKKGG